MTELDRQFLQQFGGVDNNSFVNKVDPNPEDNEDNEPVIIKHSSYQDYKDLIPTLKKHKNKFSILSTNIQGIRRKANQLKIFIKMLKDECLEFSAICVQEAWYKEGQDDSQICLDGYDPIKQGFSVNHSGGLIIYLNTKFSHTKKNKLNSFSTWEGQVIQVKKGEHLAKPVILGNFYRHPFDTNADIRQFLNEFEPVLKNLESSKYDVAVTGDFNIDLLKVNTDPVVSEFFDLLTNHSFFPKITLPTRLSRSRGTLIDNIFCKLSEHTFDTDSNILIKKFSDHQPYFTFIDNAVSENKNPKYITITKNDSESQSNFFNELKNDPNLCNFENDLDIDPNISYNKLHTIIQLAKEKHMPTKKVRFKRYKHKKNDWITIEIIKSIEEKDKLYKQHKMTDPNSIDYEIQKLHQIGRAHV